MTHHPGRFLIAWLMVGPLAGCSNTPPVGAVSGTITVKGKPVAYGSVMFVPETGPTAAGTIQPDGSYRLTTFRPHDGALVGAHKVVVEAYTITKSRVPDQDDMAQPASHKKYYNVATTPLTATVQPGSNTLDFDLE
jgi:hypothetical protein